MKEDLSESFSRTCPEFQKQLELIGQLAGLTTLEVYALWRKYDTACHDQSTLVSEFIEWYAPQLGGDIAKLRASLIQPFG